MNRHWLRRWLDLAASFLAGIAISIATDNPIVGAVLPALMAGLESVSVGCWLLKIDPRVCRARICCVFYLAAACWKGAAAAFTSIFLFGLIETYTGNAPTTTEIAATLLTLLSAVVFCSLLGLVSVVAAVRYQVRVWVYPYIRQTLEEFPESISRRDGTYHGFNQAIFVLATTLIFPMVALCGGILIVFVTDPTPNQVSMVPTMITFALMFLGPLGMIPVYGWLSPRVIARDPAECWPQNPLHVELGRN